MRRIEYDEDRFIIWRSFIEKIAWGEEK